MQGMTARGSTSLVLVLGPGTVATTSCSTIGVGVTVAMLEEQRHSLFASSYIFLFIEVNTIATVGFAKCGYGHYHTPLHTGLT